MADRSKRHEPEQVIRALTGGVVLIDPDQQIVLANKAALAMHGVDDGAELGGTVDAGRDSHLVRPEQYPVERVLAEDAFDGVIVGIEPRHRPDQRWVHRVRSLVINDDRGEPDYLGLVIADASDQFEAEDRFERAFASNPARPHPPAGRPALRQGERRLPGDDGVRARPGAEPDAARGGAAIRGPASRTAPQKHTSRDSTLRAKLRGTDPRSLMAAHRRSRSWPTWRLWLLSPALGSITAKPV